ncbi:ABC transporter ATP-binding protein, partial [Streptomyces endophyticus]|nr:ABC transporter ATP-binding protein [Streptomyces endophyticus]
MTVSGDRASGDTLVRGAIRHSAGRCAALCALTVASAGAGLLLPYVLGRALDALFAAHAAGVVDSVGGEAGRWLLVAGALVAALVLLDAAEDVLTGTMSARTRGGTTEALVPRDRGAGRRRHGAGR